jgi:hypothetical protein
MVAVRVLASRCTCNSTITATFTITTSVVNTSTHFFLLAPLLLLLLLILFVVDFIIVVIVFVIVIIIIVFVVHLKPLTVHLFLKPGIRVRAEFGVVAAEGVGIPWVLLFMVIFVCGCLIVIEENTNKKDMWRQLKLQ